ncbi:cupin domain-containing protein [Streptomyces sp. NPDC002888]|uniref:cupin domain-containing protein n=1 Tax=Streptomyces sp. NPDC002888 TaxID=3364668 RepID=UPI00367CF931
MADLLNGVRTRGTVLHQSSVTGPWAARFEDGSPLALAVLVHGSVCPTGLQCIARLPAGTQEERGSSGQGRRSALAPLKLCTRKGVPNWTAERPELSAVPACALTRTPASEARAHSVPVRADNHGQQRCRPTRTTTRARGICARQGHMARLTSRDMPSGGGQERPVKSGWPESTGCHRAVATTPAR